jgi:hypothetical protein
MPSRRATRRSCADALSRPRRAWIRWSTAHAPKLTELVTCPHCAGFHLSWIAYLAAVLALGRFAEAPLLWHLVMCWAVAGGQVLANGILGSSEAAQED